MSSILRREAMKKAGLLLLVAWASAAGAQKHITTPKEAFGFNFGDDYVLANYKQISGSWGTLEKETDLMKLVEIGKTAEGRPHLMAIVSSPTNLKKLEHYRDISA